MTRVLVTGANGFVGSNIVDRLRADRFDVVGLVRATAATRPDVHVIQEWTVPELTRSLAGAHAVVHAASVVHRPNASGREYEAFNVQGTKELVTAATNVGVRHVIFLSSIKVYGEAPNGVVDESTPTKRDGSYSASKLEAEHLIESAHFSTTILRLSPVFGRGDKGNVRRVIRGIARHRFAIPGDGSTRKSVVHVSTVANVVAQAVQHSRRGLYIVADPVAPSIRELANAVARALGRRMPPSVPIPLMLTAAKAVEWIAWMRKREPVVSPELIRKSLRPTICSPARLQHDFGMSCHVDFDGAIHDEVCWLRESGLL